MKRGAVFWSVLKRTILPCMTHDPQLERYLELCQRIYERMERDGTWPWKTDIPEADSTLAGGMVDSESDPPSV